MWRLLPFHKHRAAMNMAIDEAVSEAVARDAVPPTIRLYAWEPSAVSIGRFQKIRDEVDLEECARQGIDVVRRRTGGGAVYHDRDGEITYSVIAPEELLMGHDIQSSYREVCGLVIDALGKLGIKAEYAPINDVIVGGRKVSGCAQSRRQGVFVQHGTVLYDLDVGRMFSLLRVDRLKLSDKGIAAAEDRVTSVSMLTGAGKDELLDSLRLAFCQGKEWAEGELSAEESARASELSRTRYGNAEWTFSR